MLRTIAVRNQVLNNGLKRVARSNVTRCLSTELSRKKLQNRILTSSHCKRVLAAPQWSVSIRRYASLPSHIKVNLPALSPTMESGSIVRWEKKEGDKLSEGDLLCEIETDKATMGFETPEEGFLAKIIVPAGSKGVSVGKLVCIIVENQKDVAAFKDFKDDGAAAPPPASEAAPAAPAPTSAPATSAPAAPKPAAPPAPAASEGRVYASPFARKIAELKNLRLGGQGTGLYGSLKSDDLSEMAAGASAAQGAHPTPSAGSSFVDLPLSGMRETIAKRLAKSKQTVPHYQLSATVNIEKTMAFRKAINEKLEKEKAGVKISLNDIIVKAVASACRRVPEVNSYWMDTHIRQFQHVDVSMAVAVPNGLITPIVAKADSRGIIDIARCTKELAAKARDGSLAPNEYQGGTVTVSNLGMYGITMFNAIINPPQSLIVACGGLQDLVVEDKNAPNGFRVGKFVTFTASADHRVVDGALGAQWMKVLKEALEDPANIIL